LRIVQLQQHRSISFFGWGSSSKSSPDEFAAAHGPPLDKPPQAIIDTWELKPPTLDPVRPVKASHATSDTPDPSISSPPYTPEPKVLHDLENTIAVPHGASVPSSSPADTPDLSTVTEHVGYLKNVCGLDYGYGPTSCLEWTLEHLHITLGLPWAMAIPAMAVVCHVIFVYGTIGATDTTAKMRDANPIIKPLRAEYMEAAKAKDQVKMIQLRTELSAVNKEYGISMWKAFLPLVIQVPLQFGAFRLLRGMTSLPVPAFEHEPWLWTTDLTIGDPYFILPVMSSALVYLNIKMGTMAQSNADSTVAGFQKMMVIAFPILNLGFMLIQPGAVQLFFIVSSALVLGRTKMLNWPWLRAMLKIHPLPPKDSTTSGAGALARLGGMNRSQATIVTSSEKVEVGSTNRSLIDKVVDKVKAQGEGAKDGFKTIKTTFIGKAEEKEKSRLLQKAEEYEAKRRRDLDEQKQYRNESRIGGLKQSGIIRRGSGNKAADDVFEEEDDEDAAKATSERSGGRKRRTRR
jgi:YidC/Oxa1 family membrane protein insertase